MRKLAPSPVRRISPPRNLSQPQAARVQWWHQIALCGLAVVGPASGRAAAFVQGGYQASSPILDINLFVPSGPHPNTATITPTQIHPGANADGSGLAQGIYDVSHGVIKVKAEMNALANSPLATPAIDREHAVTFWGAFNDTVTLTAPGVPAGAAGVFVPVFNVHHVRSGTASGVIPGDASYAAPSMHVLFQVQAVADPSEYQQEIYSTGCYLSASPGASSPCVSPESNLWILPPIHFKFGEPFDLTVQASAIVGGRTPPGGSFSATSDASTTLTWLGLAAVFHGPHQITDYAFAAQSAFSYHVPVQPEAVLPAQLNIEATAEMLRLTWSSNPLQVYQVEHCTDLATPVWQPLGQPIVGDGSEKNVEEALPTAPRFYRLSSPAPAAPANS